MQGNALAHGHNLKQPCAGGGGPDALASAEPVALRGQIKQRRRGAISPSSPDVAVVLGAGVAGLAAANWLSCRGWQVVVIEQASSAGGGHRSRQIGPYTFDLGSIFYEHDAQIFYLAPDLKAMCPLVVRHQRRIAPDGRIRHYPLDPREVLRSQPAQLLLSMLSLLWSRLTVRRDGTLDAIARHRLGRRFFESTGLASYIARFHHASARDIDETFFFHRMAFIERFTRPGALARHALRAVLPRAGRAKGRSPLHVRPRDGFEPIFERIVARLQENGVTFRFEEQLQSLRREGDLFVVQTSAGGYAASAVVSAIPLDGLHRALFEEDSDLPSLDMAVLFVSAARLDPRLGNVFYNFHAHGRWKRATVYSRIYTEPPVAREFMAIEVTLPGGRDIDPQAMFAEFSRHMEQLGLASGLTLEGHDLLTGCYPAYTIQAQITVKRAIARIARTGVITVGRQGRSEYLPTSSAVMRRVWEELDGASLPALAAEAAA